MATKTAVKMSRQERLAKLTEKIKNTDVGGGGSQGFWSPKEGRNVIRILPEVHTMEYFYQTVGRHNFPPDGKKSCYCPKFTSEGELPCPVCEMVDELYRSGVPANKDLAGKLRVRKMYWMNVIVRGKKGKDGDSEDEGPFIYTPGVTVFTQLASLINDPDYGDIMDIHDGIDVTVERSGTGMDTEYQVNPRRNSTPLTTEQETLDKWFDAARDLSYVEVDDDPANDKELSAGKGIYVLPYDRIVREMGLDAEEEEDAEADEEPVATKKSRRPIIEDTEDDDDQVDEDDDADEDDPPAKMSVQAEVQRRMARRSLRK